MISVFAFGCLNYSVVATDIHGKKTLIHAESGGLYIHELNDDFAKRAKEDLADYQRTKNLDSYLNYATSLVYLGEYEKAINIFKEIEEKTPDKYEVSSNLGTAYELNGDNKNALKWIKKALTLNKDSHHGSEWVHVKILENKLGKTELENLLGVDFGKEKIPKSKYSKQELDEFVGDLTYQLSERTQFVKPKEQIVGKLYFELGNALALVDNLEIAQQAYSLSKQYGYSNPLLEVRTTHFKNLIQQNKESGKEVADEPYEPSEFLEIDKKPDFKNVNTKPEKESEFPLWGIVGIVLVTIAGIYLIIKNRK